MASYELSFSTLQKTFFGRKKWEKMTLWTFPSVFFFLGGGEEGSPPSPPQTF